MKINIIIFKLLCELDGLLCNHEGLLSEIIFASFIWKELSKLYLYLAENGLGDVFITSR